MKEISVIGLDLAKNVFQIHGVTECGEVLVRKVLRRSQVLQFFAKCPPCLVGMEACGGAHYWSREIRRFGHEVKMMAPAFVKPYLKANKNDRNDAEAICEAVQRPSMRFVAAKSPEQQSVLHLHHSRRLLVKQRVAVSNHLRGILSEYGIVLPQGERVLLQQLPSLLEDGDNTLPMLMRHTLATLMAHHTQLAEHIGVLDAQLQGWHKQDEQSQRLASIPGVGLQTATALAATVGDGKDFRNGRQLAAYLGLVPRQHSSGGRPRLLGISKRGDSYLRGLLIHGARAVIRHIRRRLALGQPGGNPWVEQLLLRCHPNEVAVALANKMARIAWVVLSRNEHYQARAA
ncbi:IS110 family transposase [uncultured Zhongshania sp.]|jgi:transposase|uniref:IS110 family transposase n=1 Tax=uncultured Zhongshania sp. TaxID=1642288 RepID=UPI0030D7C17E|tara:strand:- start:368 stop:1402 length:1035 start_codon:yes stop_codon:yes gene_type:complete